MDDLGGIPFLGNLYIFELCYARKKKTPYHPVIHHGKFDDCPMRCSSQSGSCLGRRHAGGKAQLRGFAVPNDLPEMGPKTSPNVDECGH